MLARIDKRLHEDRPVAVQSLPVPRQLARRQPQHLRSQVADLHPGKQQVPAIADHQIQALAEGLPIPADPAVAAGQRLGREVKQQAAQRAAPPVQHVVAQMRSDRLAVAQRMVALHPVVPQLRLPRRGHRLQLQGLEGGQRLQDRCLRGGATVQLQRPLRPPTAAPLGRQLQDAAPLQLPQHAHGEAQAVGPAGCLPAQLHAHGMPELGAAEVGKELHGLLDGGDLAPRQALAAEGRGREIADARIHAAGACGEPYSS